MKGLAFLALLLGASCGHTTWVSDLVEHLECGMSLEEVRGLTRRDIRPTSTLPWLGSYRIDGRRADIWLDFEDERLISVTTGKVDGLTTVRVSPKRNLCTGDLTFRLSLVLLTRELLGARVHLDGHRIVIMDKVRQDFEVSGGIHDLRLEKPGHDTLEMKLTLGEEDAGEQRFELNLEGKRIAVTRTPAGAE